jgi:hypothetical protein
MPWRLMEEGCIESRFLDLGTRGEWSASRPGHFTPGERAPSTLWKGGWVDPRTGLDDVEKTKFLTLPGLELRPLGRPARGQSLCRLRHCGSFRKYRNKAEMNSNLKPQQAYRKPSCHLKLCKNCDCHACKRNAICFAVSLITDILLWRDAD